MYSHVLHEFILHPRVDKMIIIDVMCRQQGETHKTHTPVFVPKQNSTQRLTVILIRCLYTLTEVPNTSW